jgi:hypothetical protein
VIKAEEKSAPRVKTASGEMQMDKQAESRLIARKKHLCTRRCCPF